MNIDLKPSEIELFKKFREYQDLWEVLFNIKGGKAVLHFDRYGKIRKAEADHVLWMKVKKI